MKMSTNRKVRLVGDVPLRNRLVEWDSNTTHTAAVLHVMPVEETDASAKDVVVGVSPFRDMHLDTLLVTEVRSDVAVHEELP